MEGTSNLKSTTIRTSWKDDKKVKFFLDCCVSEVTRAGRSGTSLRRESWERVGKLMKESYDMVLNQKQMKNQFDYHMAMYVEWCNLVNKNTGHGYNPITRTMDWTAEKWDEYLKAHPKAAAFRMSSFKWEEEAKALFEGVSATRCIGWGPASKGSKPVSLSSTTCEVEDEPIDLEGSSTMGPMDISNASNPVEVEHTSVEPSKKKKKQVSDIDMKFEKLIDIFMHDVENVRQGGSSVICAPSLIDCCKKLDEMTLDRTDVLYAHAAIMFSDEKMREQWMQGAVGALDGTLVHAKVPIEKQTPYRGRGRDVCYQNVLAICDFNMLFTFVFAGWEGVAHDSRVLQEVAYDPIHCFPFPPPDKYYLCDAAYVHTKFFMTPYRNTRYWISDFRRGEKARNKEEVFNQAHTKLRNVIERTFGVLKARFRILDRMPSYSLETQRDIVIACCAIHNYLRREKVKDQLFEYYEDPNICIPSSLSQVDAEEPIQHLDIGESSRQNDQQFMIQLRDQVANTLMARRARTQR